MQLYFVNFKLIYIFSTLFGQILKDLYFDIQSNKLKAILKGIKNHTKKNRREKYLYKFLFPALFSQKYKYIYIPAYFNIK